MKPVMDASTPGSSPLEHSSRAEIQAAQTTALHSLLERAWHRIPFYRELWGAAGIHPDQIRSIAEISRLPIIRKQDLEDDLRNHPPFGTFQGDFPMVRIQSSSGSTGKPKPLLHTRNDWERITDLWARRLAAQGVTRDDRVQIAFTYALFIPGFTSTEGAMKLGATVIPTGSGAVTPSERQLEIARDWGATVLGTTGGYALHLAEVAEQMGLDPRRDFRLRIMYHTGEPLTEESRQRIQERWGVRSYNNYGSIETGAPAWECVHQCGMHISEDAYLFEVVDPQTLQPLPDGEEGVLVVTSLLKEAAPVIRYMIGDIATIWSDRCACGRTFRRLSPIRGRVDDMMKIRGVAVYPTAIEGVLRQFPDLGGDFRIIVDRDAGVDKLLVKAEWRSGHMGNPDETAEEVQRAIKLRVGVQAAVEVHPFGQVVPPSEVAGRIKSRRVVDLRNLQ